jgi:hypothetical protein
VGSHLGLPDSHLCQQFLHSFLRRTPSEGRELIYIITKLWMGGHNHPCSIYAVFSSFTLALFHVLFYISPLPSLRHCPVCLTQFLIRGLEFLACNGYREAEYSNK